MTTLSVFMPVLNEEKSVARAIDSVLAQAKPGDQHDAEPLDLEVLVSDGRSADDTAAVVATIESEDGRVRLLRNDKVTIPAALNLCLRHATGDYVARVDGHSEISADYFATALRWLSQEPGLAGVGGHRTGVADTKVGRAVALVLGSKFGVGNSIYHYATERQLTDHATFGVYRAEAVRQVGGWDENLPVNEDVDFDHRLRQAGWQLGYEPEMVVQWHVRETIGQLFKQYRRYGRGKAWMVRKNGRSAVRLRHLAPPTAVGGTIVVALASIIQPWLLVAMLPYAGLLAAASVLAWRSRTDEPTSWVALPAGFVATHAGWGLGFIEGLVFGRSPARASGRSEVRAESPVPSRAGRVS